MQRVLGGSIDYPLVLMALAPSSNAAKYLHAVKAPHSENQFAVSYSHSHDDMNVLVQIVIPDSGPRRGLLDRSLLTRY